MSVENTVHIVDIARWQLKYILALYAVKIYKNNPPPLQAMLVHHVQ